MTPLILVTGFGPFAGLRENPSAVVARDAGARRVAGVRLVARVLPVSYAGADARVAALCKRLRPDGVLSLGVALGAPVIRVETTALNRADFRVADARGVMAETIPSPDGAAARVATYNAPAVLQAIREAGVPATLSHHAGTHLCNLTLYHFLGTLPPDRPAGFLHLPLFPEHVLQLARDEQRHARQGRRQPTTELPSMSRDLQVRAALAAVRVMAEGARRVRLQTDQVKSG